MDFSSVTISDWIMIIVVFSGPIAAVQIQKYLERQKESKDRKLNVFRDLMTTRASPLAPLHVSALNMVGLEFQKGKKYTKVLNAWTTYLDHLNTTIGDSDSSQVIWADKKDDLLSDLLYEMGQSLGFDFDKVHIKKAGYVPVAYSDQNNENQFIRREIIKILSGEKSLPIQYLIDEESLKSQQHLQKLLQEHLEGVRSIPVSIQTQESDDQKQ